MRIAIVTNTLPPEGLGGAESYAAQEAVTLAADHEILVLSGSRGGDVGDARVVQIPRLADLAHDARPTTKLMWHARDQWRPSVHRHVARALREFRPHVVHAHSVQGLSAAAFTGVKAQGGALVYTAHDLNVLCMQTGMTRHRDFCGGTCAPCRVQRVVRGRALTRAITRLVAVSDYISDQHVAAGIVPANRAVVLRLGAPTTGRRVRSIRDGVLRVGFLGTIAAHKGIKTLLAAFVDAPVTWRLTIAGAGPLQTEVAATAACLPHVEFIGHVTGSARDSFFDAIDLLVIPSEWEEPAALVGTEAAARAIPSIVSDRGGLPELAGATTFRARSVSELRATLACFAEDSARLELASRRLYDLADGFSWDNHVERLDAILREAANERVSPDAAPRTGSSPRRANRNELPATRLQVVVTRAIGSSRSRRA